MKNNSNNITFGELNLDFNEKLFADEFDNLILPYAQPFVDIRRQWGVMPFLNSYWQLISEEKFKDLDAIIQSGGDNFYGMTHYWSAVNLMKAHNTPEHDVGARWRSAIMHQDTILKDQFKDSKIVKWIQTNIPFKRIVGIHCVSIEPGNFASIHRDSYWGEPTPNPAADNGIARAGFVIVCLNVSNGGVPLYWAMDHEKETPRFADAKCYLCNDYWLHGVPITNARRRQVRITFEPKDELFKLLKQETVIIVPDNYHYH